MKTSTCNRYASYFVNIFW